MTETDDKALREEGAVFLPKYNTDGLIAAIVLLIEAIINRKD